MRILCLVLCLVLAACGAERTSSFDTGQLRAVLEAFGLTRKPPEIDLRASVSREMIDAAPRPLIYAGWISRDLETLLERRRGGTIEEWIGGDGTAIVTKNGLPIRTHRLGYDLSAADVDATYAALRGTGPRAYVRTHSYLTPTNQISERAFQCALTMVGPERIEIFSVVHNTRKFAETCRGTGLSFENTYWLGPSHVMQKSQVWISPEVGHLLIERL